ncbi:hypothetical protein [Franconibacter helveticus]|uniref:hypothetical protein n=1 Tax=Franconibacter helveticus TaxID=357240 RepID=UPI00290F2571|nr:hypothetical protein [Franconibacter helveticus]MDU6925227.1 hypothetical protein [Franconibacter helveticus]
MNEEESLRLTLLNENQQPIIVAQPLDVFPNDASQFITEPRELSRVADLAGQIFSGYASVPNRTVELLFKPEIKKGLESGAYKMMQTTTGETLADVVDKGSRKIVGKARIIEGGKIKQLAAGSFQLLSIIVAQSHLADINRTLNDIQASLSDLRTTIENEKLAKIHGRIEYLQGLIVKLKNGDFDTETSQQIKNKIEDTVTDANEWQSNLFFDVKSLIDAINNQQDADRFGTGDTYKALLAHVEKINALALRHNLILKLALLLNYLGACLDPTSKSFSQFRVKSDGWQQIMALLHSAIVSRSETLLKNARFNSDELLELRRFKLMQTVSESVNAAQYAQANFDIEYLGLQNNLQKVVSDSGKFRLAIAFDEQGGVSKAAIVN